MNLPNLFRKKPVRIQVVRKEESHLRLSDWRADHQLCADAAKLMDRADFRLMLSVLKNEHPSATALPYGVTMDDRVVLQCRAEGYQICLNNLEAMGKYALAEPMPEAEFAAD